MTVRVERPGLLTTVQDGGRDGLQAQGIGPGGAMDPLALRVANILVANDRNAAALEVTLTGPTLRFEQDALIAVTGASLSPAIDGAALPAGRAIFVHAGAELRFGACTSGCRGYVAFAGGIDVPVVLGSRSTNLRARFGGFEGRALRAGDRIALGNPAPDANRLRERLAPHDRPWAADGAGLSREVSSLPRPEDPVRLLPGADLPRLAPEARAALFGSTFRVSPQSDRMGYRLEGVVLSLGAGGDATSEAVTPGTVQLPPDGNPIILLADRQTTGGYPVIGHVATVDLPAVAQRKPGDALRFAPVSLHQAQQALIERERTIEIATQALHRMRTRG